MDIRRKHPDLAAELDGKWNEAANLQDGGQSPLAYAIVQEAMEATEPHFDPADMADAVRTIADDCLLFAAELTRGN